MGEQDSILPRCLLIVIMAAIALPGSAQGHSYQGPQCEVQHAEYDASRDAYYLYGECCDTWSDGNRTNCEPAEWTCTRDTPGSRWYECERSTTEMTGRAGPRAVGSVGSGVTHTHQHGEALVDEHLPSIPPE